MFFPVFLFFFPCFFSKGDKIPADLRQTEIHGDSLQKQKGAAGEIFSAAGRIALGGLDTLARFAAAPVIYTGILTLRRRAY